MARRKLEGLRAIITGASQGIGRALAVDADPSGIAIEGDTYTIRVTAPLDVTNRLIGEGLIDD